MVQEERTSGMSFPEPPKVEIAIREIIKRGEEAQSALARGEQSAVEKGDSRVSEREINRSTNKVCIGNAVDLKDKFGLNVLEVSVGRKDLENYLLLSVCYFVFLLLIEKDIIRISEYFI